MKPLLPATLWFVLITVMFLLPGSDLPKASWFGAIYLDKWVHVVFFFILVWLFYRGLPGSKTIWILVPCAGIIYGILIEIAQGLFTSGRGYELLDIAADTAGCLMAAAGRRKWIKK